jgi:transposase InsO family protein
MSGRTVSAALDRVIADGPTPRSITVDHGTEFMSRTLEDWAYHRGVQLDFIRPGKPVEKRVHRGVQWTSSRRMLERAPIHVDR